MAQESGDIKQRSILIVDDDETLRELHAALFKDAGYVVSAAEDGERGWELLLGGLLPSIVLTGVKMPRLDGFGLLRNIQADQRFKSIPVVMYSHEGLIDQEKNPLQLGAADFITRNITPPPEVLRRVNAVLGRSLQMKISVDADRFDGKDFLRLLSLQSGTGVSSQLSANIIIEPTKDNGLFKISYES